MELELANTNLQHVAIVDTFDSLIWTDRYSEFGDFEISIPVNASVVSELLKKRYLFFKDSDHAMIIEDLGIHSDIESGNKVIVKGRSLESILDRRIVPTKKVITGNFQNAIENLLNENAISPSDTNRRITRLAFEASTDPAITALEINRQFLGDFLYDAISDMCLSLGVGFKITVEDDGTFLFKLYSGADRSYDQLLNPYVIFSPKFENIIYGDYKESIRFLKTTTLVAGEVGVGSERFTTTVDCPDGAGSDLERREMFSDASGVSRNVNGATLSDADYIAHLREKGIEDLAKNTATQNFEGKIDSTLMYIYGQDFFMGDVVQVEDEYGHEAKSRVVELIHAQDISGIKAYPTFSTLV